MMSKHPLFWFYLLAYSLAWLGWMPIVLGSQGIAPFDNPAWQLLLILPALAPALAALMVTRGAYGKAGVGDLFKALVRWRVAPVWYIVAVFVPLLLLVAGRFLTTLLDLSAAHVQPADNLFALVFSTLVLSLFSNPWEEVGWRGFALPHLQKRYSATLATFIIGMLWALWHLPLFFWKGNPMSAYPFLPWAIGTIAGTYLYTWIYNSTRGSLFLTTIFHVSLNTLGAALPGVSIIALALLYCLAAILLIGVFGSANLSRQPKVYTP